MAGARVHLHQSPGNQCVSQPSDGEAGTGFPWFRVTRHRLTAGRRGSSIKSQSSDTKVIAVSSQKCNF